MTVRKVLIFPDPKLRNPTKVVENFDDAYKLLIDDMLETMYEHNGVGLAAPQIAEFHKIIVIDVSEERDQPLIVTNPKILESSDVEEGMEGCISFPGIFDNVKRAHKIKFKAHDRDGNVYEMDAEGLLAVCVQHEMDHLAGKLLIDYVSPMKKNRILKKMQKLRKLTM